MAQTPEGRVKEKIKKVLDRYSDYVYYEMKVPNGYGSPSLDYFGSARNPQGLGIAFAIEAKRPGRKPTARQEGTMQRMGLGGVRVFAIDGEQGCDELDEWLDTITGGHVL